MNEIIIKYQNFSLLNLNQSNMKMKNVMLVIMFLIGMQTVVLAQAETSEVKLSCNVTCNGCKSNIEQKMKSVEGVSTVEASVENKEVTVKFDPAKTDAVKISSALKTAGYENSVVESKGKCPASCKKACTSACAKDCKKPCCQKNSSAACEKDCKKACCNKDANASCAKDCMKPCCAKSSDVKE
ncbi:MAG: heavy-metal-associated domain-containing protein [Bacteroidales bacterium]|nr:heavy-metal-associated domain-containing protein [Bacteroidales bacterium]